eukprot:CAMPEP_0173072586 /NCGR_PEP_ID=MMETSP1102-20130122/9904_1 /TAXON_ID=49646 /ORGANISM="Geminigera sp., Strain Caron Lab Isolate" /LENGTH=256 /DNA_ID=CAMNT_0013941281 /DNA_START=336 /DNA_END=1103 /DNA_ORIENTATION=+
MHEFNSVSGPALQPSEDSSFVSESASPSRLSRRHRGSYSAVSGVSFSGLPEPGDQFSSDRSICECQFPSDTTQAKSKLSMGGSPVSLASSIPSSESVSETGPTKGKMQRFGSLNLCSNKQAMLQQQRTGILKNLKQEMDLGNLGWQEYNLRVKEVRDFDQHSISIDDTGSLASVKGAAHFRPETRAGLLNRRSSSKSFMDTVKVINEAKRESVQDKKLHAAEQRHLATSLSFSKYDPIDTVVAKKGKGGRRKEGGG